MRSRVPVHVADEWKNHDVTDKLHEGKTEGNKV
jgi:hypothetical protein